jgi:hypothetical protein
MSQEQSVATEYIHNRLALTELDTRLNGEEAIGVVDFNVTGITETPVHFASFAHAQEALETFAQTVPKDEANGSIRRGTQADITFTRLAQGEELEFEEKMLGSVGFVPQAIPENGGDSLLAMQGIMTDMLQEFDFTLRYDRASEAEFLGWLAVTTQAGAEQEIMRQKEVMRGMLSSYVAWLPPSLTPRFVTGVPWSGGVTMENQEFVEYYNVDPTQKYTPDEIQQLVGHESTHHIDFAHRQQQIRTGQLAPSEGVTGIHSPETTQAEVPSTFGEGLPTQYLTDPKEALLADFRRMYNRHFDAVKQNALIAIGNGVAESEVVAETVRHMPFADPGRMCAIVQSMNSSILMQINTAHYWRARQNADIMLDKMNDQQRRQALAIAMGPFLGHNELTRGLLAIAESK